VAIYVPQIINLLRDNADPGVVCHVLQLCKDQHLQLQNFEVPQIRIKVVDPKKAKPASNLNLLGSDKIYKKLTKEILQKDSIEMIELKPAKQIKTVSSTLKAFEEKKNDDTFACSMCIYAAQLFDNFLKQNKTEEEILEELKSVCIYFHALEAEVSYYSILLVNLFLDF